jgi:hypothetical protein
MKYTNPYRNNYEAIRYLSKMIDGYFEGHGFTNESKKELADNPDQFAWKSHDYPHAPEAFQYLPKEDVGTAARYGYQLFRRIRELREINRGVDTPKTIIQKSKEASELNAITSLNSAFPSISWDVESFMRGDISVEKGRGTWGTSKYVVGVPVTWNKKVFDNGIAEVKAGDGMRFVMDAKERKLERLNDIGIRAFSSAVLKVKNKQAEIENAWVMSYETSDDPVLAVQTEFNKCESLMRRRIKDTVTKELLDF